jgi:hypothetical protein
MNCLLWFVQAAKPCSMPASADNVKSTDNRGRKWGWENDASCAFKVTHSWLKHVEGRGQMFAGSAAVQDSCNCSCKHAPASELRHICNAL